jgi:trimethylamine--corrinoid protein Co-methyltransferase
MNSYERQVAPINVFSNSQLEEIHMGTLEVLRRTGIKITHLESVELLWEAGCWIDGERVRIPSQLIAWAIDTAPKRVVLCNRQGDPTRFCH